jgi:hypothetical protein
VNDQEILRQVERLVNEEHELLGQAGQGGLDEEKRARVRALEVSLDQCWDLLRQRRARREFGLNPDEANVRDATVVEHYEQ